MSQHAGTLRRLYAAFMAQDRTVPEAVLAGDFTFTSPFDDAIDKEAWFRRCWPGSALFESLAVETIAEDGDNAFVLYRCVTKAGTTFRNVERVSFADERIRGVEVFFGATYRNGRFVNRQKDAPSCR